MTSSTPVEETVATALAARLEAFLGEFLGAWPPVGDLVVASSAARNLPGWDGRIRRFSGIASPEGTVVSVPHELLERATELAAEGRDAFEEGLGTLLGKPGATLQRGIFRAATRLVDLGEPGVWLPSSDARLPEWLQAFPGEVLVAFDSLGRYAAGVGLKRHSDLGREIAVGTEPAHRGRGLGRALVAQATRWIYLDGAVATYLHAPDNFASAAVAEAAGFPDRGWRALGLSGAGSA